MRENERRLKDLLRDEYGATDIRLDQVGKHPHLRFCYQGVEHDHVVSKTPSDWRSVENELARIKRSLGPPPPPETRQPKTLEQITHEAEQQAGKRALATRALSAIQPPSPVTSEPMRHEPDNQSGLVAATDRAPAGPPLSIRLATEIMVMTDEVYDEHDLVFQSRRKTLSPEGAITTSLRAVAAVTLPTAALLALYDAIEPIARRVRPATETESTSPVAETGDPKLEPKPDQGIEPQAKEETSPPLPFRQREPAPEQMARREFTEKAPHGYKAIIALAESYLRARDKAARMAGTDKGVVYNRAMAHWYAEKDLAQCTAGYINPIRQIAKNLHEIREWGKTRPLTLMSTWTPGQIYHAWSTSAKSEPTAPLLDPVLRKVERPEATEEVAEEAATKEVPAEAAEEGEPAEKKKEPQAA